MRNVVEIECPPELLIGLHTNAEQFAERVKREAAYNLFRDGAISSGIAANWLGMPRASFLLDAMRHGSTLLDDSEDDFRRETNLP
jgi:predicted HTH domain antitoxin